MNGLLVSTQITTGRQTTFNVFALPTGTYVIKVGQYAGKFMKQ
jgi:hypothetical protein